MNIAWDEKPGNLICPESIIQLAKREVIKVRLQGGRIMVSRPHKEGFSLWATCIGCTGVEDECPEHGELI